MTGLRFFLAIWVVFHHLTGTGMLLAPWAQTLPPSVYAVLREGYLAVGAFFALSGFVLAHGYSGTGWTRENLNGYALRRVARVYPAYLLSLLVMAPYIGHSPVPGKPFLIANYALLLQGWTGTLPVQWNTPAWSLSCEIFFYFCFPLASAVFARLHARATVAVACMVCFLPAILWGLGTPDRFKPLIHLADFLIGIVAARAYSLLRPKLEGRGQLLYLPAIAFLLLLLLRPVHVPALLDFNGVLRPFLALMLLGFALSGGLLARVLSLRCFVYLGKTSYSLYILHIPILWWFKRWAPFWFPGSDALAACVYVAVVLAISGMVYSYIEEPANGYLRNLPGWAPFRRGQTVEPRVVLTLLPDQGRMV